MLLPFLLRQQDRLGKVQYLNVNEHSSSVKRRNASAAVATSKNVTMADEKYSDDDD
jgi:hypothetical protein